MILQPLGMISVIHIKSTCKIKHSSGQYDQQLAYPPYSGHVIQASSNQTKHVPMAAAPDENVHENLIGRQCCGFE